MKAADAHGKFRSEKHRLARIQQVRSGELKFFEHIACDAASPFLDTKITMPLSPLINVRLLLARPENKTLVYCLSLLPHYCIAVKIYPLTNDKYVTTGETRGILNHQVEIRYLKIFSELVQKSICPYFTLPIGHAIMSYDELKGLVPRDFHCDSDYMVLLSEYGDSCAYRLLHTEKLSLYSVGMLVLQVVLTLAQVQDLFETFRHNDLHLGNVLIQHIAPDMEGFTRSDFGGASYYHDVARSPFRALLWDMFYSSLVSDRLTLVEPAKKHGFGAPNSRTCVNRYVDLHRFLDSLYKTLTSGRAATPLYPQLVPLFDAALPRELRAETCRSTSVDELITPRKFLEHPFFNTYRRDPEQHKFLRIYKHPQQQQ